MFRYLFIDCDDEICYYANQVKHAVLVKAAEDYDIRIYRLTFTGDPQVFAFSKEKDEWHWENVRSLNNSEYFTTVFAEASMEVQDAGE